MTERTGQAGAGAPKAQRLWLVPALLGLVIALFLASLATGPVRLSVAELLAALLGKGDEAHRVILMDIRLPRAILAVAIGFMLGLAGAAMQGLLRNPLAAPSLFGAPQAAAFSAVVTISLGLNDALSWGLPIAAILGAFASVFLLVAIAGRNASLLLLILAGLAVSSLAGAGTALAMNLAANPFAALEIAFWLMGSLEDRSIRHVTLVLPFILVASVLLYLQRGAFRALSLGEEAAASLGVAVERLRFIVILGVALGVGASVAVAGTIAFIGLIAPHLMRPLVNHDPARLLLPAGLAGAALLLAADIAVRIIPAQSDIKVGVLTSIIGVPFFLLLIVRQRRSLAGGVA
ncbi:MAG: iron ABC transporter permease [Beijerinckiaceae bacterium]|jgi:iron complex transport system permease protein|nr:iron ABC transporter permease [Beijerinckiaceae bacterium]